MRHWSSLTRLRTVVPLARRGDLREGGIATEMQSIYLAIANLLRRDDEGQGLAEYALILALIAIIAIIALIFLGNQVSNILSTVGNSI